MDLLAAFAHAFSQSDRLLQLHFGPDAGLDDELLLPWKLSGAATLNDGYCYTLTALSHDAFIELKRLIGQPIAVSVLTDSGDYRPISGWVTEARHLGSDGGFARYVLVIQDLFAVLDLRINNRVFQDRSAKDAFLAIVREHQQANAVLAASLDIDDRTTRDYPTQSWITQYNESDAAFGRRRLFEEGINYCFGHRFDGEHVVTTLILFDDNAQLTEPERVRFHRADGTEESDSITHWAAARELAPGSISAASYDYKPDGVSLGTELTRFDQGDTGDDLARTLDDYRHDIPHYANDPDDFDRYLRLRMQAIESNAKRFMGAGTVRAFQVGERFMLDDHPEIDAHPRLDRSFVLTRVEIEAENNLPVEIAGRVKGEEGRVKTSPEHLSPFPLHPSPAEPPFRNKFTASRDQVRLVPEYRRSDHARPQAPQLLTATVVGPAGEEIHTDELGRIRVNLHFPQDKDHHAGGASLNETDSVWIRIMQPWTGTQYGGLFIPRVGDEVLISFIGGDIDRPIVTSTVYNGTHRPASFSHTGNLPGNKTLSGIKSKMYKGQGANELVLDDTTNELRARLATDHAHTALNQGYLVHPRNEGKGTPRGEGFELRTDQSGALRAAQGLLLTTDARPKAQGNQLDRQEMVGQLEAALAIAKQLGELANTHHADDTDTQLQEQLLKMLEELEQGSNTTTPPSPASGGGAGGEGKSGRQPVIAISAPAGIAMSTQQAATLHAGTHFDSVTVQDTNLTQGKSFKARAKDSISLFAHKLGMKLIAASGKVEIQAQSDDVQIIAAKDLNMTALEEIVLKAPKITLIGQGAGMELGSGQITSKTVGTHTEYAASHNQVGPRGVPLVLPVMPQSMEQAAYSQRLDWEETPTIWLPMPHMRQTMVEKAQQPFALLSSDEINAETRAALSRTEDQVRYVTHLTNEWIVEEFTDLPELDLEHGNE